MYIGNLGGKLPDHVEYGLGVIVKNCFVFTANKLRVRTIIFIIICIIFSIN